MPLSVTTARCGAAALVWRLALSSQASYSLSFECKHAARLKALLCTYGPAPIPLNFYSSVPPLRDILAYILSNCFSILYSTIVTADLTSKPRPVVPSSPPHMMLRGASVTVAAATRDSGSYDSLGSTKPGGLIVRT